MATRKRRRLREGSSGGNYFAAPSSRLQFIPTGASVLDCNVGGGWPLGRIVNIVGDQASGKTLLAIEAMANFTLTYPKGRVRYRESEAAFIPEYAAALGLPIDKVEFTRDEEDGSDPDTVERFFDDLDAFIDGLKGQPGLYIVDSLDAISDEAEINRAFSEGTYGTGKAKQMSQLFRKVTSRVEASRICLIIISQTRDRINAGFGRRYSRSGGRALDFYASIILYLAHMGEITRTVKKVKRPIGVKVRAKCTKNKIGLPFRSCDFPIIFAHGIEDVSAGLDWLKAHSRLSEVGMSLVEYKRLRKRALYVSLESDQEQDLRDRVDSAVRKGWREVEQSFLPKHGKYTMRGRADG